MRALLGRHQSINLENAPRIGPIPEFLLGTGQGGRASGASAVDAPKHRVNKKDLTEADIRTKFITPAILASGWDLMTQLREEAYFTKGRVMVRGKTVARGEANLEVILAVGFRVRSHRGTRFRKWANARLSEYLVKGFTMDDERLKNPPGPGHTDYFDELLERIRDIRASERRFYQKVLDIYATSIDYQPDTELS